MQRDQPLTKQRFLAEYARYFGLRRVQAIEKLGYLVIEASGEGPWVVDTEGRRYLDLWGVGGVNSLGHRHPSLVAAMQQALRDEDFGSLFFFSEAKARLAEALARTTPAGLEVTWSCVTGSEAIDQAIKLARGSTGRSEVLHADHGYHGVTGFALSMMGSDAMRAWAEPLAPGFRAVPYGDAAALAAAIGERTAAVVLEPVRTDYDGRAPEPGYFAEVRRLCDAHGAKLIIDEVVTGMGRLGHLWGSERFGIEPDLLVTAKGFSGGMFPMAAVVMRPEILDFWGDDPYRIISSYAWSNVGAVVSRAAIEETEKLLPRANAMGERLGRALEDLRARHPDVLRGVRRTGLLWALDFASETLGAFFILAMVQRGVIVVASAQNLAIPKLYPPLILEDEQIAEFAEKADGVLGALGGPGA
jgi:acetylornithine/succinyldiaminopimelate/putrescine aminotransferase